MLLAQPASGPVDWVSVSPAGDFDHEGPRTGGFVLREHADMTARITYPDFAVALLDEIDGKGGTPAHRRAQVGVALDPARTAQPGVRGG